MSNAHQHDLDPEHQHEEEDEHELAEDDVVEVVEDFGDEPMDDDDDDNEKYDGEIVIGAPQPGEEEAMEMMEDNTMGATCTLSFGSSRERADAVQHCTRTNHPFSQSHSTLPSPIPH